MQYVVSCVKCPECGGKVILSNGSLVCSCCGIILEDKLVDYDREYRVFSRKDLVKCRIRPGTYLLHDDGLGTVITVYGTNGNRGKVKKLRKMNWRVSILSRIKLFKLLVMLNQVAGKLELPDYVKEEAARVLRILLKRYYRVGPKSAERILAISIYAASRRYGLPLDYKFLMEKFNVDRKIRKLIFEIQRFIKIKPVKPETFLQQIASKLNLSHEVFELACRILDSIRKANLTSGKSPRGLAATAAYIASILLNQGRTQKEIAQAARVSEVTIRNNIRRFLEKVIIEVQI